MIGRAAAALAVLVLTLGACTAHGADGSADRPAEGTPSGSDTTTTVPGGTTSAPGGDLPPGPVEGLDIEAIDWQACSGGFECATYEAPLDYGDIAGETITLDLARLPASDPDERIGGLFLNPGGPGASSIELAQGILFPSEVYERFDIVAVEPRGVGESSRLKCEDGLTEMYDADPTLEDQTDVDRYLELSQSYVTSCDATADGLLEHMGTENVARDMDLIRAALGDDQLSFMGFSYGTSIGQTYARLFPQRLRALVIDGVVDLAVSGLEAAATQAAGFETATDSFAESCDDSNCLPVPARDAIALVLAMSESEPLLTDDPERPATPGVVTLALSRAMYAEFLWPSLIRALDDALGGDGDRLLDLADDYLGIGADGSGDAGLDVYFAVSCLDGRFPRDPAEVLAAGKEAGADSPTFGEAIVNDMVRCSMWPADPQPLVPVPPDTEGLPTVLVISTLRDPATPYENGVAVADQLPDAVLISVDDDGHGAYLNGDPCVVDTVSAYLVDGTVPADDIAC